MKDPNARQLTVLHNRMSSSGFVAIIVPRNYGDAKSLIELGMAIMLDKPIALLIEPGRQLPEKLLQVADHLIELSDPKTAAAELKRWGETLQ